MRNLHFIANPIIINSFLTDDELKLIKKKLKKSVLEEASIFSSNDLKTIDPHFRKAKTWLFDDNEIKKTLNSHLKKASEDIWPLFKNKKTEILQYSVYKKNDFFKWHTDTPYYSKFNKNLKTDRILTIILMLTDSDKFNGGNLEVIDSLNRRHIIQNCRSGQLIIFPSNYFHRVTKLKSGTRKTLTMWIRGNSLDI